MVVLWSGTQLRSRLKELVDTSDQIDIAVAWVTDWLGLNDILGAANRIGKDAVRILAGVGGCVSSPDALEKIRKHASLRVYGDTTGPLYHVKLYIFHTPNGRIAWIGSPNLTQRAFEQNVEIVAELAEVGEGFISHFHRLWMSEPASERFDINEYRKMWVKAQKKWPQFVKLEAGLEKEIYASKEIVDGDWETYLSKLNETKDLSSAIRTVERGSAFVHRDWNEPLREDEAAIMFGLKRKQYAHFGFLDPTYRMHKKEYLGDSPLANNRRRIIGVALRPLLQTTELDLDALAASFQQIIDIPNCGRALTTRLLLFARPDCCVVLNKKSANWLGKHFKIELRNPPSGKQYAGLIKQIQDRQWWRSEVPSDADDRRIWEYRAALIDRLAFEAYGLEE